MQKHRSARKASFCPYSIVANRTTANTFRRKALFKRCLTVGKRIRGEANASPLLFERQKKRKKLINRMKGNAFEHRKDQKEIELLP